MSLIEHKGDGCSGSARVVIVVNVLNGEITTVKADTFRDTPAGALQLVERQLAYPKANYFRGLVGQMVYRARQLTRGGA